MSKRIPITFDDVSVRDLDELCALWRVNKSVAINRVLRERVAAIKASNGKAQAAPLPVVAAPKTINAPA